MKAIVQEIRRSIIETVDSQIYDYEKRIVQPKFILLGRAAYEALVLEARVAPTTLIEKYRSIRLVVSNDLPNDYASVIPSAGDVFLRIDRRL